MYLQARCLMRPDSFDDAQGHPLVGREIRSAHTQHQRGTLYEVPVSGNGLYLKQKGIIARFVPEIT